jgi:hypothetical protein
MPTTSLRTRRYVLAARPSTLTGPVDDGVLRYEDDAEVPELRDDQVLVRVEWLSMDTSIRGDMNDTRSYRAPAPLGEAMRGRGAGTVQASRHPDFAAGDRVCGMLGWEELAVADGSALRHVSAGVPLSASLNALGIAGQTAWIGLNDIAPKIRSGQIRAREQVIDGLRAAPQALRMLFDGANTGKLLVRVGTADS